MSAVERDAHAPRARVVSAGALDIAAHAALQQRVFGSVLEENGIPLERLGPGVFAWKLAPPRGEARVAVVEHEGALLSTCTAFPVELGRERVRAWHLCDAATAEEARGRGLFGQVLATLREGLPPDEWVFAFPNGQSRGAFERQGFATVLRVPLWVRPVIGRARAAEGVEPIEEFGAEHDALGVRLAAEGGLTATRSSAYLTWRYLRHPYFHYRCYALRREGRVDGLLVVHPMRARGRTSLWIMELLAVDAAARRDLARTARALASDEKCDVVLSMASARLPGAVGLPACFLPNEHVLMVRCGGSGPPTDPGLWDVQTGDWDTF